METIDVALGEFTRRSRSVAVRHTDTTLTRGLEPREQVLVHDPSVGYYAATVADIDFEPADTIYRLELGVRLSDQEATERALRPVVAGAAPVTRQDLLDLLRDLRSGAAGRRSSQQEVALHR